MTWKVQALGKTGEPLENGTTTHKTRAEADKRICRMRRCTNVYTIQIRKNDSLVETVEGFYHLKKKAQEDFRKIWKHRPKNRT